MGARSFSVENCDKSSYGVQQELERKKLDIVCGDVREFLGDKLTGNVLLCLLFCLFFSASINLLKTAATIIDPKKSLTTKWEYISRAIKVTLWRQRYRLSDHLFMHSSDFVGGRFVHFASEFHLSIIYVKLPEFTTQYIFYVNNIISSVNIIMVSFLNILDRSAKNDNFHDNK